MTRPRVPPFAIKPQHARTVKAEELIAQIEAAWAKCGVSRDRLGLHVVKTTLKEDVVASLMDRGMPVPEEWVR